MQATVVFAGSPPYVRSSAVRTRLTAVVSAPNARAGGMTAGSGGEEFVVMEPVGPGAGDAGDDAGVLPGLLVGQPEDAVDPTDPARPHPPEHVPPGLPRGEAGPHGLGVDA